MHYAGGVFMSMAPSAQTAFICRPRGFVNVVGKAHNVREQFKCGERISAVAALHDTAALIATRSSIWVLCSEARAIIDSAFLIRVAGHDDPGHLWNVNASAALFLDVTALVALPIAKFKWLVVGHDRYARRIFKFTLHRRPNCKWKTGVVTALAGTGTLQEPFGAYVRLETTASPMVVVATTWTRFGKNRNLRALNVCSGESSLVFTTSQPALLTVGNNGEVFLATITKLMACFATRAPSSLLAGTRGFWNRNTAKSLSTYKKNAIKIFLVAAMRRHLPLEIAHYILTMVANDVLGRPVAPI